MAIQKEQPTGKLEIPSIANVQPEWYTRIKLLCIGFGFLSILCCCLGVYYLFSNIEYSIIITEYPLPLGILAIAFILGWVEVLLWLLYPLIARYPLVLARLTTPMAGQSGTGQVPGIQRRSPDPSKIASFATDPTKSSTMPAQSSSVSGNGEAITGIEFTGTSPGEIIAQSEPEDTITISELDAEALTSEKSMPSLPRPSGTLPPITSNTTLPGVPINPQVLRDFRLPREGVNLELSQDRLASSDENARYAVADGVGTSFLPAQWAQIITNQFVSHRGAFETKEEITWWLKESSKRWHNWVETVWIPEAQINSGQEDWSRYIARGAAATFVGCSFSRAELNETGTTHVRVVVAGDAEFFLLSPPSKAEPATTPGRWRCKFHYRLELEDFGHTTEALATPEKRVERDYKWVHIPEHDVIANAGDYIVLTTDALARWILLQISLGGDPWRELFSILPDNQEEFRRFVHHCRSRGEMETDDTTIMIIPVQANIPKAR